MLSLFSSLTARDNFVFAPLPTEERETVYNDFYPMIRYLEKKLNITISIVYYDKYEEIIKNISEEMTKEFGKGFSKRTVWEIRQFYTTFPEFSIVRTLSAQLSWSPLQRITKVQDNKARIYYLKEAASQNWSIRTLDRNISK